MYYYYGMVEDYQNGIIRDENGFEICPFCSKPIISNTCSCLDKNED